MGSCPICGTASKPRAENPSFPFCTARCKMVDLGKWINEEYRVPSEDSSDDGDRGAGASEEPPKSNEDVPN
jgi:uncharacterized protein